ncbi:MAG: Stp1/IreP family PP2C-type Ser/Thr phosphatase [Bdellovibrionaceae bacterium]|nr:Stp1/IreP family PP2C-type Ser/Thr phosphatase [Pseudobdellovibrionaceae bacterium]MBX3032680.1 Stp1/IreP family PP2C-type Ser/Thr phosphatase [Pseudobdellovibrionaceae bacterium]
MKIEAWFLTDKGLRRDSNQDSCLVNTEKGFFTVADGMGGHSGGEVASSIAVSTVDEVLSDPEAAQRSPREVILKAYETASQRIYDKAAYENTALAGMGTTMVLAYVRGQSIYVANVGDSRCYMFKKPYLWQITEDHSLVNEQIRAGLLSEDQARAMVGRNVITRSVGYEREVHPDIIERHMQPGEIYILCSDGLTSMVPDERIGEILDGHPPERIARLCIEQALAHGGDDNVTVVVLHVLADSN